MKNKENKEKKYYSDEVTKEINEGIMEVLNKYVYNTPKVKCEKCGK
jgi:hypothetical protein